MSLLTPGRDFCGFHRLTDEHEMTDITSKTQFFNICTLYQKLARTEADVL